MLVRMKMQGYKDVDQPLYTEPIDCILKHHHYVYKVPAHSYALTLCACAAEHCQFVQYNATYICYTGTVSQLLTLSALTFSSGILVSLPMMCTCEGTHFKYLPLPQPTSATSVVAVLVAAVLPAVVAVVASVVAVLHVFAKNSATLGHGL
jgi:hypothetical protein